MNNENACDIIIPVYNKPDLTENCLKSIEARTRTPYRLILIDNASDEATRTFLEAYKAGRSNVTLVTNKENTGWVKAVNQGIKLSDAPYVCIMNNDTVVGTDDWLSGLIAVARSQKDIGLVNPDFAEKENRASGKPFIEIDFCRGYCILAKRAVIDSVGGLDEAYGLGYYDDDDFSVRAIRAGFRCVKANNVTVRHLRDSTFTSIFKDDKRMALHEKNKELFYSKWGRRLKLVFIITGSSGRQELGDILLSMARRQHIVYLWNTTSRFGIEHINVRERVFPPFFTRLVFSSALYFNRIKREAKRYNAVFTDSRKLGSALSASGATAHYFEAEKDAGRVGRIVDSAAFPDRLGTEKVSV
jgi:GT2 family glycosyltransferase